MDNGENNHHGHHVEETARDQDPEVVIVQLHKMEDRLEKKAQTCTLSAMASNNTTQAAISISSYHQYSTAQTSKQQQ